ncbi:MAG: hypothetical protein JNM09_09435 [Blastocatellia bacterium]|nr:hypothetical protein [Blastocatellia bacterium]
MNNTRAKRVVWCLVVLLALPVSGAIPLRPGTSITVDCVSGNVLTRRSTSPLSVQNVVVQVEAALDSTGTVLTLTLQNNSASATEAALYALDLGLPTRFVNVTRMQASFAAFPLGARWEGPTDVALPTNATGTCTFAAREIIATGLEAYLKKSNALSSGFLGTGQSGRITVKLAPTNDAPTRSLQLNPIAYLLASDPDAPDKRRQIASTAVLRAN